MCVLSRAQQLLSSLGIITSLIAFSFASFSSLFWHCACVARGGKRKKEEERERGGDGGALEQLRMSAAA